MDAVFRKLILAICLMVIGLTGCKKASLTYSESDPEANLYDDITDPYTLGTELKIPIVFKSELSDVKASVNVGAGFALDSEVYLMNYARRDGPRELYQLLERVGTLKLVLEF